jgi:CheY-like chemotaxis protein
MTHEKSNGNHVLVVEDDRDLREGLTDALELEGYAVVGVEHGEAALRHLRSGARPCVILLDLMMPVMDGWTFRREILGDVSLAQIPVVIMTAATAPPPPAPGDAFLRKPLEIDSLVDLVQRHCTPTLPH